MVRHDLHRHGGWLFLGGPSSSAALARAFRPLQQQALHLRFRGGQGSPVRCWGSKRCFFRLEKPGSPRGHCSPILQRATQVAGYDGRPAACG
jgi:hypothetical protein